MSYGLAYRVTGRAARDKVRAEQVQAGIANIEQRKAEQHQALNAEQQGGQGRAARGAVCRAGRAA